MAEPENTGTEGFFAPRTTPREEEDLSEGSDEVGEEQPEDSEDESESSEEEQEESEQEEGSSDDQSDYKTKFEEAEAKRKQWQSRHDTAMRENATQLAELQEQLKQLKQEQGNSKIDDLFKGKEKDDLITVEDAHELIKEMREKNEVSVGKHSSPEDQNAWMASQPDYNEVSEYFNSLKEVNPNIEKQIPGKDTKEAYKTLRKWMIEDERLQTEKEIKELREENLRLKKKSKRPRTPVSGAGKGLSGGGRSSGGDINVSSFFQKPWNK
jgi:hypothetical protein